ncbi:MAG TPA: AAA family ATPase [Caldilineaceae bacterium]|nr:AAA family ATPase [Caldilineaceae bacterium]
MLKHKAYDDSVERLPLSIRHKATWAQVLLGIRGRTPSVKGTYGLNARWRRTPVQGNHYYMWWIPRSEGMVAGPDPDPAETNTILIHSVRHHDATDEPIDAGSLADYEEIRLANLDPRYPEQKELSQRTSGAEVALATIKGLPGSGKTVSLLYLVKDLAQRSELNHILYVTYSSRLKRAARDFLLAQNEAISAAVTIRTLGEIEQELTGLSSAGEPFSELRDFIRLVETQNNAALGPWRKYPQTLYTEIRAHLLGKSLPASFSLPEGHLRSLLHLTDGLDAAAYAASRELDLPTATLVVNFAERLQSGRFFQEQRAPRRAIELLQRGRFPNRLADLDALVLDEVQDLTLVQIALLGELVRAHLRRRPHAPFVVTVAGDESQIVQPSGFDWGITKELLGEQIGIWPEEFEFHYQRRAPRNLAQLIDNTWRLYGYLPKAERPSARRQAFLHADESELGEGQGRILTCPPPLSSNASNERWLQLFSELSDKPGRVLIDLTETLRPALVGLLSTARDEVLFLAREIKGLERATVLIHGLNTTYERAMRLATSHEDGNIPRFEARRLFDEIRVAVSRSTDKIIVLEPADAPVLAELGVDELPGVGRLTWESLLDTLKTEEMSEIEVIEGYLDEVDDLYERALWAQARRRNRRAFELAKQLGDLALQREAEEQQIRGYMQEAAALLQQGEWAAAYECNQQAALLASELGDLFLQEEIEEQSGGIGAIIAAQVDKQLALATEQRQRHQFGPSHETLQLARSLVAMITEPALAARVDEALSTLNWTWAAELVAGAYTVDEANQAADLLAEAAAAMLRQADKEGAEATTLLAERYRLLPQREQMSESQVETLLAYGERYLTLVRPLNLAAAAYRFVHYWLDESYANLHLRTALYTPWVLLAQEYARHDPAFEVDEPLWDLENRVNMLLEQGKRQRDDPQIVRFQALLAAYNRETPMQSGTWEQLGELAVAADFARDAGELERAARLLHQAKTPLPEELAIAVKATRLLQQLRHKYTGLRPAERRTLLAELTALQNALALAEQSSPNLDDD